MDDIFEAIQSVDPSFGTPVASVSFSTPSRVPSSDNQADFGVDGLDLG